MSDSLNLGPIPFPPDYRPYIPPERRRRLRRAATGSSGNRLRTSTTGGSARSSGVGTGWVSISPDGGTDYVPLLGVQQGRIRGALGASFASHAIGAVILLLIIRAAPATEELFEPNRTNYDIVWIPQEGPGGGGGGGGNESLELPREVEVAGDDAITVPVEEPVELEPSPEQEPLESHTVRLSALSMAAAPQTNAGLFEGLMARSLDSVGSGTGDGAGAGSGGGIGPGEGDGLGPGSGGGTGGGPYRPGNGVETPRLLREVTPKYTAEAMRAKVQGVVLVEAVVLSDGSVGDVRIVRSLDRVFGLDQEAIKAARQWRFLPGTRFGEPVAVLVTIELSFTLR